MLVMNSCVINCDVGDFTETIKKMQENDINFSMQGCNIELSGEPETDYKKIFYKAILKDNFMVIEDKNIVLHNTVIELGKDETVSTFAYNMIRFL